MNARTYVAQGSNHHGCKSSKHFHVIIPDEVAGIIQQLAIKEDRSFSNMVVQILKKGLKKRDRNPQRFK